MPDQHHDTILPGPSTRDTEGEECPRKHLLAIDSIESGLIVAGPCIVPPPFEEREPPAPTGDSRTQKETPREEPRQIRTFAFLPWSSNGLEHGLKRHKIAKNGYVYETGDRPTEPRRKSKGISSRQWGRR